MITMIFRMRIKEGKEEEALERLRKMTGSVQEQEPGALAYLCHRSQAEPSEIVFFEMYADASALKIHTETDYMGEFRDSFGELFDLSQVKVERLDQIAGFARGSAD